MFTPAQRNTLSVQQHIARKAQSCAFYNVAQYNVSICNTHVVSYHKAQCAVAHTTMQIRFALITVQNEVLLLSTCGTLSMQALAKVLRVNIANCDIEFAAAHV